MYGLDDLSVLTEPEWCSITLGGKGGEYFTMVDPDLYPELIQWKWSVYHYRNKLYAKRYRDRFDHWMEPKCIYMHRWIMWRRGIIRPTAMHVLVDHKNSNGLDNRSNNLVWATPRENSLNCYGMWWQAKACQKDFEEIWKKERGNETAEARTCGDHEETNR